MKYRNNPSDILSQGLFPKTTFFSSEANPKAKDKDVICTHPDSLAVYIFTLPKK